MKILCVIDSLGSGGAQRQLVGLAKGFKQRGHEVSFLVYHKIDFFKKELDEAGIQVHSVIEPNYLKRLFKMRRFIRSGKYDAVLSFLEASGFICEFAALPFRSWRLVVGERNANPHITKSFKKRFYRWFHVFADYVVANSKAGIDIVRETNPFLLQKKQTVIYNMVNLDHWKPIEYSTNHEKKRLLIASSLAWHKNILGLVDAVRLLNIDERTMLSIEWYGREIDDSKKNAIEEIKIHGLQSVFKFYPETPHILPKTQKADAVGLFSFYEGLPNAICEGMACGKPIVASSVSDVPVLVEEGVNGHLCNPHDISSIVNALRKLINATPEQIQTMGAKSREKAERLFEQETIISKYIQLFSK